RQAIAIWENLTQEFPDKPLHAFNLAISYRNVGDLFLDRAEFTKAREAFEKALSLNQDLVAQHDDAKNGAYRQHLATSYYRLGLCHQLNQELDDAENAFHHALKLRRELVRDFPTKPEFIHQLAESLNGWGSWLTSRGEFQEAKQAYREAIAWYQKLPPEV